MRYNLQDHHQADQIAQEHGFVFAVYMGHYKTSGKDRLVFMPYSYEPEETSGYLLQYILIDEKKVLWKSEELQSRPFMDFDTLKEGRKLYRELEDRATRNDFKTEEERDYLLPLYQAAKSHKVFWRELAFFLQESTRLNRKIVMVANNEPDVFAYSLRLE